MTMNKMDDDDVHESWKNRYDNKNDDVILKDEDSNNDDDDFD